MSTTVMRTPVCDALIVMHDQVNPDPLIDCRRFKRGDMVAVVPDDWPWSEFEKSNPNWRIAKFPLVSVAEAEIFIAAERDLDPANPSRMLRQRARSINVDSPAVTAATRAWLDDDSRVEPFRTFNFTLAQMVALSTTKSPLQDPNVMG